MRGRVGALIEVAAGFHPDLTGRENIYLQGAVMGMKRAEIDRKFDEIVEFAGVGEFIDTPVKRYSSGMNARLGFSIAAHLDPEVLIIDEVLSVGDAAFQRTLPQPDVGVPRTGGDDRLRLSRPAGGQQSVPSARYLRHRSVPLVRRRRSSAPTCAIRRPAPRRRPTRP